MATAQSWAEVDLLVGAGDGADAQEDAGDAEEPDATPALVPRPRPAPRRMTRRARLQRARGGRVGVAPLALVADGGCAVDAGPAGRCVGAASRRRGPSLPRWRLRPIGTSATPLAPQAPLPPHKLPRRGRRQAGEGDLEALAAALDEPALAQLPGAIDQRGAVRARSGMVSRRRAPSPGCAGY